MKYTRLLKNFLSRHVPEVIQNYLANNYWENLDFDKKYDKNLNKIENKKIYVFGCNGSGVALMPYLGYKSISLITNKTNSPITITKIRNKKKVK